MIVDNDDPYLPISGLQHLVFCERQAALILVERSWAENALTVEGGSLHRRTDSSGPRHERRGELVILRGVDLHSKSLGLIGIADVVELQAVAESEPGVLLPGIPGIWQMSPVEYKRGKPKPNRCDEVQVCAQAMCLEEMFGASISSGALFYGTTRRRKAVMFDDPLRSLVRMAASRLHEIMDAGVTPPAEAGPKCRNCSLMQICMPEMQSRVKASNYIERMVFGTGELE